MTSRPPWALVGAEVFAVANSRSPVLCPAYDHYSEYHAGFYDPTSTLIIRVETLEAVTNNHRVVGCVVCTFSVPPPPTTTITTLVVFVSNRRGGGAGQTRCHFLAGKHRCWKFDCTMSCEPRG
jgi:hypothetical protein